MYSKHDVVWLALVLRITESTCLSLGLAQLPPQAAYSQCVRHRKLPQVRCVGLQALGGCPALCARIARLRARQPALAGRSLTRRLQHKCPRENL